MRQCLRPALVRKSNGKFIASFLIVMCWFEHSNIFVRDSLFEIKLFLRLPMTSSMIPYFGATRCLQGQSRRFCHVLGLATSVYEWLPKNTSKARLIVLHLLFVISYFQA